MKKIWHVYELYNLVGTIEWVGETINPKYRFIQHTKKKAGKFYGRTDISMHIVKLFDNGKEAWDYQCELQKEYGFITDKEKRQLTNNGFYGKQHSTETKLKLSEVAKGRIMSNETKSKISQSTKGKPKSSEHNKKNSEAMKLSWAKRKNPSSTT